MNQQEKKELAWALVSRVLTDEELGRVADLGIDIYIQPLISYRSNELYERLNGALLQQFRLRKESAAKKTEG